MNRKHMLAAIFSMGVNGEKADARAIASKLGMTTAEARREVAELSSLGLVSQREGGAELTPKGRRSIKVIFIGGGFELIHYGHVYTIGKARSLGDALIVSVARDSTIRKRKNREPIVNENDRVRLLSSLRQVDAAILGVEGDIYVTLERVRPDIVALGYDQHHLEAEVEKEAKKRGMKLQVVRFDTPYPEIKTSKLLKEL